RAATVFPRLHPASLATATTRARGCLRLFATIRQEVLGMSGDPDIGQQRLQIHIVRRQGRQQRSHIRKRLGPVPLGPGQDAEADRRCLAPLIAPDEEPVFAAPYSVEFRSPSARSLSACVESGW